LTTGWGTCASTDQEGQARNLAPACFRSGAARCDHRPLQQRDPHRSHRGRTPVPSTPGAAAVAPASPRVTGERPGATRAPAPTGQPASGRRTTGEASRRRARSEVARTRTPPTRRRHPHRQRLPARPASRYLTFTTSPPSPPLTPDCLVLLYFLLLLTLDPLPLAAAPPPALPPHAWAALQIYLAGRGRGVQRVSGGPPFLECPGAERKEGRRWGGGSLISKDQQLEINTHEAGSRTRRVHLRARAVGSRESVRGLSALVDGRSGFGRDPASHERMFVPGGGARLALRSHWRFLLSPHYSIGS
jgi:hypothetical protein